LTGCVAKSSHVATGDKILADLANQTAPQTEVAMRASRHAEASPSIMPPGTGVAGLDMLVYGLGGVFPMLIPLYKMVKDNQALRTLVKQVAQEDPEEAMKHVIDAKVKV